MCGEDLFFLILLDAIFYRTTVCLKFHCNENPITLQCIISWPVAL